MSGSLEYDITKTLIAGIILGADILVRLFLLFYIPRNRKPTSALAWLFAIAFIPFVATVLFLIIGRRNLSKQRRAKQEHINNIYKSYNKDLHGSKLHSTVPAKYASAASLAEELTCLAPTGHNNIDLVSGYNTIIDHMTKSINKAQQYIYVEFFAIALDKTTEPFFEALENARQRNVEVYVLFDYLGSRKYPNYRKMKQRLNNMGAKWRPMLPISFMPGKYNRPDLRNHRKILVTDNTSAYIGSLNLIDKTYHRRDDIRYAELTAHIEGPAVNEAAAIFASDWYAETDELLHHFAHNSQKHKKGTSVAQMLPSGPGYPYRNNLKVFVDAIHAAEKSICISSPYFVPDESLLDALTTAAIRGVRVCVLNSEAMDQWMVGHAQRSYYEQLMETGIEIWLYKKPQLLHSKYMIIDEDLGIVGSSNLDIRSFELNLETSAVIYDPAVAKKLHMIFQTDLSNSRRLSLETWKKRPKRKQLLDSIARLTSAVQ